MKKRSTNKSASSSANKPASKPAKKAGPLTARRELSADPKKFMKGALEQKKIGSFTRSNLMKLAMGLYAADAARNTDHRSPNTLLKYRSAKLVDSHMTDYFASFGIKKAKALNTLYKDNDSVSRRDKNWGIFVKACGGEAPAVKLIQEITHEIGQLHRNSGGTDHYTRISWEMNLVQNSFHQQVLAYSNSFKPVFLRRANT